LKKVFLLCIFLTFLGEGFSQTNLQLLQKISSLQSKGSKKYAKGLFPSQRTNKILLYKREDDNVFFTGLIAWTLRTANPSLTEQEKQIADSIIYRSIAAYPAYRNKDGLETYNFWRTNPSGHFPNGIFFSKFKKFRIPDDIDDTSILYLSSDHSIEEVESLKNRMILHANLSKLKIKNTFKKYKDLKAYSTWFGKKMPIDFDACVITNALCFVYKYNLPLNEYDSASIRFVQSVILADEHVKYPYYIARHYRKTSVILYHVARLISNYDVPGLSEQKPKIIADIQQELCRSNNYMEKVLLSTSLLKLGVETPPIEISIEKVHKEYKKFNFFVANMLTSENSFAWWLSRYSVFHLGYRSEAYYLALLLEYNVHKQSFEARKAKA
jgi:hypothetical protein